MGVAKELAGEHTISTCVELMGIFREVIATLCFSENIVTP